MTLAITSQVLPDGEFGTAYSATLSATGGTAPYTWSISSGALPPGLTLNTSTGVISGTPTNAASSSVTSKNYSFTITVTDNASATALDYYVITVYLSRQTPEGPFSELFWGGYWSPPPGLDPGISDITTLVDFSASSIGHEALQLEWTRATEDVYDNVVIVRNTSGYPKIISEGEIIYIGKPSDKVRRISDNNLSPGFYYYSLFFREISTTPVWVRVARTYGLIPFNYESGKWLFELLPEWYQEIDSQTSGHPSNEEMANWGHLRRFLEIIGTQYDGLRTEVDSILESYDAKKVRVDLLEYFSSMYGFPYENQIGERQLRMLMDNWFYILKRKGTLPASVAFISALTGYPNKIHLGSNPDQPNLFPSADDSEAYTSVGQWKIFDTYFDSTGVSNDYLATSLYSSKHTNLQTPSTTGELDVRVRLTSDAWTFTSGNARTIIARYTDATNKRSWRISVTTGGTLKFFASKDGTNTSVLDSTCSASINLVNGNTKWIRVRFVSNTGSGNGLVRFYKSDDGSTWTQVGSDVTFTSFSLPAASDEVLTLGRGTGTGYEAFVGKIHEYYVYNKVDSTTSTDLIAGTNFDEARGSGDFYDNAGNRTLTVGASSTKTSETALAAFGSLARAELNTATPLYYTADVPNALKLTGGYGHNSVFNGNIAIDASSNTTYRMLDDALGVPVDPAKTYRYQAAFRHSTTGQTATPTLIVNWYNAPKKITDTASCVENSNIVTGVPYITPGSLVTLVGAGTGGQDVKTIAWEVSSLDATPQENGYTWTLSTTSGVEKSLTGNLTIFQSPTVLGTTRATGTQFGSTGWTTSAWVIQPSDIPDNADIAVPGFSVPGAYGTDIYATAFLFRENAVTNTTVYEPAHLLHVEMFPQRANYFPNPGFEGTGTYDGYARTPGNTSNSAMTVPDTANNSITGDIDIRVKVALDDWTPAGIQQLVGKWITSTNHASYELYLNTVGKLVFLSSPNGTSASQITSTSSVATGFANGSIGWVRVTLDVDDGAGHNVVKFYTSTDGSTWTQLGSTITNTGTTSIYNGTADVQIGALGASLQSYHTAGKFYYIEIRDGINGTVNTSIDFTNNPFKTSDESVITYHAEATPVASDGLYFPATTTTYFQRSSDAANPITGGSYSMKVSLAGTASSNDAYIWSAEASNSGTIMVPDCENGDVFSFSLTVKPSHAPVGDTVTPVFLQYNRDNTTQIVESTTEYLISGDWTQVTYQLPVKSSIFPKFKIGLRFKNAPANAVYYIDAVEIGCNEYLHQYSYFDGNIDPTSRDFEWSGAANASVSMYYPNRATREARLKALLPNFLPPNAKYSLNYRLKETM